MTYFSAKPYLTATIALLLAWAFQVVVGPHFGPIFSFAPFIVSSMVAAWAGGIRPTLYAMAVGYLICFYFYVSPGRLFELDLDVLATLGVYVLVGLTTGLLTESLIGERRRAEAAKERMRASLLSIGDAVIATDDRHRIVTLNPIAEQLTDWTAADAIDRPLYEVFNVVREGLERVGSESRRAAADDSKMEARSATILISKNGKRTPIEQSAAPIHDDGRRAGVVIVFRDVAARRRAEQTLRVQYEVASTLAESSDESTAIRRVLEIVASKLGWQCATFWTLDTAEDVLRCREHWYRGPADGSHFLQTTYALTFAVGRGLPGIAWQRAAPVWIADITQGGVPERRRSAADEDLHAAFATPAVRGNQVLGVLEFFSTDLRPRDEEFLEAMQAVGRQVGQFLERCQAARSLEHTVARNAAILAAAMDGIVTIDDQERILEFNPAAERMLGFTRQEVLGGRIHDLIVLPPSRDGNADGRARFFQEGQLRLLGRRIEMQAVDKSGQMFPVEVSITRIAVQYPPLYTVYLRDLREHYRAEADRRESEQRNKLLAELTSDYTVSFTARADGSVLLDHVSEGFTDVTGFTLEEIQSRNEWQTIYLEDDLPKVRAATAELLAGQKSYLDVRVKTKSGDFRWIRSLARPVFDEELGRVTRIYAASQDVTEKLKAEQSLTLHSRVLENMTEGVSVIDDSGRIVFTNRAQDEMFGYSPGELIGQHATVLNAYPDEHGQRLVSDVIAHLREHGDWSGEWENCRHDGTRFTTEARVTSLTVGDQLLFVSVQRDVTEQKAAAAALRESERNAQEQLALVDHVYRTAPVGMGLIDRELRYVRVNELLASIDGRTPDDCLGKTIREVVPDLANQLERLYHHVFETGQPIVETEITGVAPGTCGQEHHWLVSYHPVYGPDESVVAVSAAVVDITQRKRAEDEIRASEQRFRSMADSAPVMIWLSDTEKSRSWFNRPWLQFTGRTMDQELGRDWSAGIHPEDRNAYLAAFNRAFDARKEYRVEYRLRRRDGQYRWILDHGVPLNGTAGRFLGYIGSAIDIHDHRLAEQSLRDADTRKNEFLAMLAHELRNPLAIIQYAADISRLSSTSDLPAEWATTIEGQVRHLARLVDDLLDLSRLSRGKIAIRPEIVDAAAVVRRAADALTPLVEERHQYLVLDLPSEPVTVLADETRLAQVVQNLVTNAAKYSETGGRIVVSLKNEDDQAIISVTDNGVGMPANLIPYVFDLFRQGERTLDRSQGGLGIGLTLVREIVQLHGGTVHAHSDGVGRGSSFTVKLPVRQPIESEPGLEETTMAPSRKSLRVMVIEDNTDAARGLQLLLQGDGHQAVVCHSGLDALEAARQFGPDVVLLDLGLPGKDGYQVASELRNEPALRDVLIVAVSGYSEARDLPFAASGIDHHLVKPVSFEALRSLLTREVEQRTI